MPRRPLVLSIASAATLAACAILASAATTAACAPSATNLTCDTKAQSVTFSAAGSCSGAPGGTITISTEPGLCAIVVSGAEAVNLPTQGQFLGSDGGMDYDLTKGNWYLALQEGNASEGSTDDLCDVSLGTNGELNLACSYMVCQPDDCTGASCSNTDCTEHLTATH